MSYTSLIWPSTMPCIYSFCNRLFTPFFSSFSLCIIVNSTEKGTFCYILNGCPAFKGLYIACHHRIVEITANGLSTKHTNRKIELNWFKHLNDNSLESVLRDSPNTPDIVVVDDLNLKMHCDSGSGLLL